MSNGNFFIVLLLLVGLLGCQTNQAGDLKSAVLIDNSKQTSQKIGKAVVELLNGMGIILAKDAFENKSSIIIEQKIPQTLDGSMAAGSVLPKPTQLTLMMNSAQQCFLVNQSTQRTVRVDVKCKVE
ncbi:hypothetical protein [Pleionea sediminis]|uniref:hypothetical protein n=1 Tax=Pleionea sediminis TaxID=2569479 RepID=UPI00118504E3|nr:hypothetical protein [Pleionea sediminis]